MNTSAYLESQGWLGTGHPLPTSSPHPALSKPLLVSQKRNRCGVGRKTHTLADQWWVRAFEVGLEGLDVGEGGDCGGKDGDGGRKDGEDVGGGQESGIRELEMVRSGGGRGGGGVEGGLYGRFVRGEGMEGTFGVGGARGEREKKWDENDGKRIQKEEGPVLEVKEPCVAVLDQAVVRGDAKSDKELRRRQRRDRKMEKVRLVAESEGLHTRVDLDATKAERRARRREKRALRSQVSASKIASESTFLEAMPSNGAQQEDVSPATRFSENAVLERKRRKAAKKGLKALNLESGNMPIDLDASKKKRSGKHKLTALEP
ncbi:MAG: hypothetical protein M1835_007754 [Candelina submexicana]|nr:MAG: hypothetical protein M1835_007754 [Candelina submexicana]